MAVVIQHQTYLDLAVQETGTVSSAVAMAIANGESLTDDLTPGTEILVGADLETDASVLAYIVKNGMRPASGQTLTDSGGAPVADLEGIGYWIIGLDFKVS